MTQLTLLPVTVPNIHGFEKQSPTDSAINVFFLNLVVDNPPRLKNVTTVPCNLSLITTLAGDCRSFSDINVLNHWRQSVNSIGGRGIRRKLFQKVQGVQPPNIINGTAYSTSK